MKIVLYSVGRTSYAPFREGIERYAERIPHYAPFEYRELPDIKNTRSLSEAQQKEQEADLLLASFQPGDHIVLLDERGKEYTSRAFAKFIGDKMNTHPGRLVFVIGGPYGFAQKVYDRCNGKLSLSMMTFPHELVRLFFVEQIYRAFTILRGEPYHHD